MTMKRFGRKRCGEIAAQNITAQLADSLIGSLCDLTAIDSEELRRQVVMLIDHSYALGPLPFEDLLVEIKPKIDQFLAKCGRL